MKLFFSLLLKNVLDRRSWATRDELRAAVVHWFARTITTVDGKTASAD